jgi:hypothetical protein
VTVFEPYSGEPLIRSVTDLSVDSHDGRSSAVRVELADGQVHYVYHSLDAGETRTLDGKLTVRAQAACLVLDENGDPVRATMVNGQSLAFGPFEMQGRGERESRISQIDYSTGAIELEDPVLDAEVGPGIPILVAPEGFADCVTVEQVIDSRRFSIGDEDLQAAGGPVTAVRPEENRLVTTARNPHARVGMTVLNSRGEPQGRLASQADDGWILDRGDLGPMSDDSFPGSEGDAVPRYRVMVVGPGVAVRVPSLVRYERSPDTSSSTKGPQMDTDKGR